ncbi:MAG TPA: hypothetical protein P5538_07620 [Bacteroidales bacterium]|nr:hypothetical protein [Bacteroidales bacterium]HOL97717.1 hypothetical protein [Bacteroidales bacterium]HOM36330.1 hypothetical protein [Bacteroidales bacterium]HPD23614.1 hypothetical protein [Bacteroidales bacterium]HRS99473.1 hypothetical protein [Bacteroidales bacterium]
MSFRIKHIIFILLLNILGLQSFSQNTFESINIKEDFDYYNWDWPRKYSLYTIDPNKDWNTFGDGLSKVLDGFIDLFIATKDKAYLYKFILQSLCIIENRNDINPYAEARTPKWTETDQSTYADGYITASFAKFIFLVRVIDSSLINTPLYQFEELDPEKYTENTKYCNFSGIKFNSFGEYADWLEKRTRETIDFFVYGGLWDYNRGILQPPGEELVINMQTGFARTLLFLGLSTDNPEYLLMADTLAYLHQSTVRFYDRCEKIRYENPVFILNPKNDSYWWYHNGWRLAYTSCRKFSIRRSPSYVGYTKYIEDVSHGKIVMMFPYEYLKFRQNQNYFSSTDMRRFRNTFVYNLYDYGNYKIAVDGSVGTTYAEEKYNAERLEIIKKTNAIAFANFAEFDYPDDTLKVLDITMKEYKEQLNNLNLTPRWYGGQKSLDHAQMVLYQWTYYNPSLTLYSRNLVYDQDFFSKASLTIEPRFVRGTKSYPVFAEPFIFTDSLPTDRFLIDSGVKVNITAKESIRIKPGFYAKKGSICRIKIISDKDKE